MLQTVLLALPWEGFPLSPSSALPSFQRLFTHRGFLALFHPPNECAAASLFRRVVFFYLSSEHSGKAFF